MEVSQILKMTSDKFSELNFELDIVKESLAKVLDGIVEDKLYASTNQIISDDELGLDDEVVLIYGESKEFFVGVTKRKVLEDILGEEDNEKDEPIV